jgi:hypothetical protein
MHSVTCLIPASNTQTIELGQVKRKKKGGYAVRLCALSKPVLKPHPMAYELCKYDMQIINLGMMMTDDER